MSHRNNTNKDMKKSEKILLLRSQLELGDAIIILNTLLSSGTSSELPSCVISVLDEVLSKISNSKNNLTSVNVR